MRTLMKATGLIRRAGLRARIEAPEAFLRRMNRLSMEMSQQARRAGTKKEGRKRVLRQMKKLVGVIQAHAAAAPRVAGTELGANRVNASAGRAGLAADRRSAGARASGL